MIREVLEIRERINRMGRVERLYVLLWLAVVVTALVGAVVQIGRASCRERVFRVV